MTTQREINRRRQQFQQKSINEQILPPKVIQSSSLLYGSGGDETLLATVIVAPTYPDRTADPASEEYNGISYYIVRPLTSSYPVWEDDPVEYSLNAEVIYPEVNGRLYKSKEAGNKGHQPDISPDEWECMDEIKIEYALGMENNGADLKYCYPRYAIGEVMPLIKRTIGETERYYIDRTFTYFGTPENSTVTWNQAGGYAQVVFR